MADIETVFSRFPIVPLVGDADMPEEVMATVKGRPGWDKFVPNNMRTLAHAPELAVATRQFLNAAWDIGTLGRELKILIRMHVSNLNACVYCSSHQLGLIRKMGVADAKLNALKDIESSPALDEREKTALVFAEALIRDSANISDELARRVQQHFSHAEAVEIAIVVSAMGVLNLINDGLRVPLEEESKDNARLLAG